MDVSLPGRSATAARAGERSVLRHVDVTLLAVVLALVGFGLLMVYSATNRTLAEFGDDPALFLKRQGAFAAVGVAAMVVVAALDYRFVRLYAGVLYAVTVLLLVLVQTPLGTTSRGAQRWFQVGGLQLSPSLFTRLTLAAALAAYLAQLKGEMRLRHVLAATGLAVVPMFLVFIQPDIGTSIILAAILVALLVAAGARAKHLVVLALAAALAIFGAFQLGMVKEYQVQRLVSFLDPSADPLRAGYNKQQAEIAVGAGGVFGRGYLRGTQTTLDFVPEHHTDFIFTVVGEELGFVGSMALLALFGVLLWRAFRIALLARDPFGTYLAVGVAAMIAIQVFINVGMTIGIMPITGIPLPFISYGGSALVADFMGIGLLLNVHLRRFA
ncbi:MAG TPA: rod shape-determining protein RodA [Actinomycetota bacterium]|nr:rod shape-determining protein RodA [Actinomycetota bacterium]